MWVLLGGLEIEEDFGGYQYHKNIFLGIFDSYETALNIKNSKKNDYDALAIVQVEYGLFNTDAVDWSELF